MSKAISNSILDAVQALERAPSVLKVKEEFRAVSERHGYPIFLCSAATHLDARSPNSILFEDWPDHWRLRYADQRYYMNDPMLGELFRTADPFLWSDVLRRRASSKAERKVMSEAAELGMRQGFVVPIYGVGGQLHAITMTGDAPRSDSLAKAELHLISIYAYARAKQLRNRGGNPTVSLGRREREALQWAAAGKTDWEIGEILGISEAAAHKRIESAKRRLQVRSRMQAVVEAIRSGQIQI